MFSFAIVIRRAYFEAKKRRKYAKNVVVNSSAICFNYPEFQMKKIFPISSNFNLNSTTPVLE